MNQALQEEIKLVPIDLKNRPDWYKEKVYPANKVKVTLLFQINGDSYSKAIYINTLSNLASTGK